MLQSFGIPVDDNSLENESCSDFDESEECANPHFHPSLTLIQLPPMDNVLSTLSEGRWNWFHFVEQMEKLNPGSEVEDNGVLDDWLEQVYDGVISSDPLQLDAQILVKQSHDAYVYDRDV